MQPFIRQPAVAGMFYPADAAELNEMVSNYLAQAETATATDAALPRAIIVPHAGYIYSGPVAASAYARILPLHAKIRRVILLGPSHRVPFIGLAATSASHFQTPLGLIAIDHTAIQQLLALPQVKLLDQAHAMEHSLEVHLPFLQSVLDEFSLVPLVVGDASPEEVAEVLQQFWNDEQTLIVISSDLSHYHSYHDAQQRDQATSHAIEAMQPEKIGYEDACGRNPLNGLLLLAKQQGLHVHTIDLRNSGDTAGDKSRVVGYGAYVVN